MKKNFKFQISNFKLTQGFTFIELILYISIVTIMLGAIIPFAWNVIGSGTKSSAEQEVFSQGRYVSERIKYEIRRSSGITSVGATSIALTNFSPDTTTVLSLSAGKMQINKNGAGAVNLNSDDTTITTVGGVIFTDYTSVDNKTKHIQFTLIIDDAYGSPRQEYNVPAVTIESSAEVRSN